MSEFHPRCQWDVWGYIKFVQAEMRVSVEIDLLLKSHLCIQASKVNDNSDVVYSTCPLAIEPNMWFMKREA
jgi:hypothetical protein